MPACLMECVACPKPLSPVHGPPCPPLPLPPSAPSVPGGPCHAGKTYPEQLAVDPKLQAEVDGWLSVMSSTDSASVVGLAEKRGPNAASARKLLAVKEIGGQVIGLHAGVVRK